MSRGLLRRLRAGPRGDVHLLLVPDTAASLRALDVWVRPTDRRAARSMRHAERRRSFLLGRALLRRLVADLTGQPAPRQRLRLLRDRRPLHRATGRRRLALSATHAAGWVVVAAAPGASAGRCIGIDVESRTRRLDPRIARRLERGAADGHAPTIEDWCRLEAVLKAEGRGLAALGRVERPRRRGLTDGLRLDDRHPGRVVAMRVPGLPRTLSGAVAVVPRLGPPGRGPQVPRR